ncbi:MAG TPA: hypothetical protein VF026_22010 [Ktedonobacteraceae bacterium]
MTYLLGWSVISQIQVRRERWPGGYKTRAVPLVSPGQEVQPAQPVMRLERVGPVKAQATVPHFSFPGVKDAPTGAGGQPAHSDAPASDQYVGETLPAALRGRVVDITRRGGVIIESRVAVLQGAIGVGYQVAGVLTMWQAPGSGGGGEKQSIPMGVLLVVPGPLNSSMLREALASGVVGVIASSIPFRDLEGFLQTNLLELINRIDVESIQAHLPPVTIMLTEGIGIFAMPVRTINFLSHYQGSIALLSGATSIRQGIFPELVISLPVVEIQQHWHPVRPDTTLSIGAQVRVSSGDHEGAIGTINYLYTHQQVFASGILARAALLRLEDGSMLTVPLSVIERIS